MRINKINLKLIVILLVLVSVFSSCDNHFEYQGKWIIVELKYKDFSLLDSVLLRNMIINFSNGGGGTTPIVSHEGFYDDDLSFVRKFSFYRKGKKNYIKIVGSKFFTDTFEVSKCSESCCEIILKNKDKYVKLIFNGELSIGMERRACPYITNPFPMDDQGQRSLSN